MAAHPNLQYPQKVGEPDCRDYLRTGRCKYGESCKYNHPPNVQSGGGVKTPLDPSEPPFPIRPGEPPCQYYMKHGTCKFGQTCKFHHPPQLMAGTGAASGLGGTVMMNVINAPAPQGSVGGQQFIALNSADGGTVAQLQNQFLQLLPQRPTEPDCIYFLRNGRCKYGATCKYHHPFDGRQQRHRQQEHTYVQLGTVQACLDRHRSSSAGSSMEAGTGGLTSIQLLPSHGVSHGSLGPRRSEPTHILVSDGPIRLMTINQNVSGRTSSYQQTSTNTSPITTSTSAASSYETAVSNLELLTEPAQGQYLHDNQIQMDSSGRFWRRSGSLEHLRHLGGGGSPQSSQDKHLQCNPSSLQQGRALAGAGSENSDGVQLGLSLRHSAEAGRTLQRQNNTRTRSSSFAGPFMYSSSTEPSNLHGKLPGSEWSSGMSSQAPSSNAGGDGSWKAPHHSVHGLSRNVHNVGSLSSSAPEYCPDKFGGNFVSPSEQMIERAVESAPEGLGHLQREHVSGGSGAEDPDDEGLSMMTSALLTMLDTPDSASKNKKVQEPSIMKENSFRSKMARSTSVYTNEYHSSSPSTPRQSGSSFSRSLSTNEITPRTGLEYLSSGQLQYSHQTHPDTQDLTGRTHSSNEASLLSSQDSAGANLEQYSYQQRNEGAATKWSPTWQTPNSPHHQIEQNAKSVSVLQPPPGTHRHNHAQHGGDIFYPKFSFERNPSL